ncbi:MAG: PIG-L family deacetylase [Oscillospiraceae bacterium]|nr:PIG-L family deacetylase [Oscillospiraceae bacterium]
MQRTDESRNIKTVVFSILVFLALAAELCLLADYILMFSAVYLSMRKFQLICFFILAVAALLVLKLHKTAKWLLFVLTVLICLSCIFLQWFYHRSQSGDFPEKLAYREVDSGKEALFAGKNVLLLVPHQDDDLNVLCGTLDEYLRYGSELTVAFMTNGDRFGLGEVRIREALDLYEYLGVPEDHVVFLGYGDTLHTPEYHIYNAPADEVIPSQVRKTETYGIDGHPPFRVGHTYTRENLYTDIRDVILSVRPDVIFCVDFDTHEDHRACSMLFEQAMGEILRTEPDYTPAVYKGFAYSTAWAAEHDFFSLNITATKDIYHNSMAIQSPPLYRWEDRIRFPVSAGTLSRSLQASGQYRENLFYHSQEQEKHAPSVTNGDKVFWKRSTDSLLRAASLNASSQDPWLLNNFMLLDTRKVLDLNYDPFDGVWSPEEGDEEKTVTATLEVPSAISEIVLFDNPDGDSNILNAEIRFDNGAVIETGPLDVHGAPTRFEVDSGGAVSSFRIRLLSTEGDRPGLTEIEAFPERQGPEATFLKLMDSDGNFAYDYILGFGGTQSFRLYSDGSIPELNADLYEIQCSNASGCTAGIRNGALRISCRRGQSATVTVRLKGSKLADSIFVQNPTFRNRLDVVLAQKLELIQLEDYELLHLPQWAFLLPWMNSI